MFCYNIIALWGSPAAGQRGKTMQGLKKCLHLRADVAALLLAVTTLITGCGRSDAAVRMLFKDDITGKPDGLTLSFDTETDKEPDQAAGEEKVAVYVCGAVNSPGVYYLPEGARACDALNLAGGFDENADTEFVNLAGRVEDGQVLRFYTQDQTSPDALCAGNAEAAGDTALGDGPLVNINLDGYDELITLPGIGDVKAKAIIAYREQNGPFTFIEQVKEVKGISDSLFEKIGKQITI